MSATADKKEKLNYKTFFRGAQSFAVSMNFVMQLVALFQVDSSSDSAFRKGMLIVYLSTFLLALDACIDLASSSTVFVNRQHHPLVFFAQRVSALCAYASVTLSFTLLLSLAIPFNYTDFYWLIMLITALVMCLSIPFVMIKGYAFFMTSDMAHSYPNTCQCDSASSNQIVNYVDPLIEYLSEKRGGPTE